LLYQETAESRDKRELLREQIKNEPLGFRDQKGRPSKRDRRHIIKFTRGD
jgi:ribosome-associated heat shock protein Hsp15